jgi:hypothetical protein
MFEAIDGLLDGLHTSAARGDPIASSDARRDRTDAGTQGHGPPSCGLSPQALQALDLDNPASI